jgi:Na+-translocating ferredoxin:NAD+ oxidoreductase RnfC subunit
MTLLDIVKKSGIVGAGGAGFPTHVKLQGKADYILLNGAECEPLLRVDQQLMEIFPAEIIKGLEAAGRFIGAEKGIIGIKNKHKKVISILNETIKSLNLEDFIEIKEMADVYPAGDEQVLVYELTGRVVPEMNIPISVGCVVINSETALNVYNALEGNPVTHTYITVAGDIPNPKTLKVPVGTPIEEVLKTSGIESFEDYSVIDGGPMMGPVMKDLNGFVTKKTKGFIILKKNHHLIKRKSMDIVQGKRINRSACEQCRMCTDLCPRYLLGHDINPHKIMTALNYSLDDGNLQSSAQLCCQCNLCELYSCPAGLYPRLSNLYFKTKLDEERVRHIPKKTDYAPRKFRDYRLLPSKRLVARLGLKNFDKYAPLTEEILEPEMVFIYTGQHVGKKANPIVNKGDMVQIGQQIGVIPEGELGAAIHSSITGTVIEVNEDFIAIRRNLNA